MKRPYTFALSFALVTMGSSAQDLDSLCLPPSAGRFWSIADGVIQSWTLSGGSVGGGSTVVTGPTDMNSLAFCSVSGPTSFYGDHEGNGIQYYSNGSWVFVGLVNNIFNHGGSGGHLYFVDINNDLWHFSGTPPATLIASPAPGHWFSSDIVCDQEGNAYVTYGPTGSGVPATEFRKYGPTGTLLDSWSTTHIPTNGWGAFMLDNTIYIAFGTSNATWPNKLVPFTLGGGSAVVVGTPITFIQGGMLDLASCTEAAFSAIAEMVPASDGLRVVPNPAGRIASVTMPDGRALRVERLQVFDLNGRQLPAPVTGTATGLNMDVSGMSDGVYILSYTDATGTAARARLVVHH